MITNYRGDVRKEIPIGGQTEKWICIMIFLVQVDLSYENKICNAWIVPFELSNSDEEENNS